MATRSPAQPVARVSSPSLTRERAQKGGRTVLLYALLTVFALFFMAPFL